MRNDLSALDVEVEVASIADADVAMNRPDFDAVVIEAAANVEETRRLLESPARQSRTAVVLLLRAEQLGSVEPAWPVDDFLVLPAAASELGLRLRRAVFQKTGLDSDNLLSCGDLVVDMANYKVFVDEQPVSLTFKEFELLRFLMTNRGKVFTREALLNRVWGYEYFGGARTVDVHIRRLRSKIETNSTIYIETVRNVGYRFPTDQR
jgi:two-component system alkaline phosphatase synthesis response regulator PhoP